MALSNGSTHFRTYCDSMTSISVCLFVLNILVQWIWPPTIWDLGFCWLAGWSTSDTDVTPIFDLTLDGLIKESICIGCDPTITWSTLENDRICDGLVHRGLNLEFCLLRHWSSFKGFSSWWVSRILMKLKTSRQVSLFKLLTYLWPAPLWPILTIVLAVLLWPILTRVLAVSFSGPF